jgi:drug/metabolite transporter (DMT)-like permease
LPEVMKKRSDRPETANTKVLVALPFGRLGPILLLLATGGVFGALFPLGKLAGQAQVHLLAWALSLMLGGGTLLALLAFARGERIPVAARYLRYYAVAGFLSTAFPNLILFTVIPHLGAGLSSVVFTLPPILTLALATLSGIERPGLRRIIGIAVGFIGAALIVGPRGSLPSPGMYGWMALALSIPASVALGNVYRTKAWPSGASPLVLSAGTLLAGALWVALTTAATGNFGEVATLARAPALAAVQALFNALQFLMFMRLQQAAGPVYVSQIGYVGTAVGLASGALVFGETYTIWVWAASAVIIAGVLIVNSARRT